MVINENGGFFVYVENLENHLDGTKRLLFFNPETAHKTNNYINHSKNNRCFYDNEI
jgi:hypothetical protein